MLLPVARSVPCKVCGTPSALHGVVDFSKCCEERRGTSFDITGVAVWYHRCAGCGLIFTAMFDHWTPAQFAAHVYNDEYVLADPDYLDRRPSSNARLVADLVARAATPRILDYGGGNGRLAALLRERGMAADSWDTMTDPGRPEPHAYDVVTAFEVFEHTPTPIATCAEAVSCLRPGGVLLFTTLTLDQLAPRSTDHWYIAPRNGHVTLHTSRSLKHLFARFGFTLHHYSDVLHLAAREAPRWLA